MREVVGAEEGEKEVGEEVAIVTVVVDRVNLGERIAAAFGSLAEPIAVLEAGAARGRIVEKREGERSSLFLGSPLLQTDDAPLLFFFYFLSTSVRRNLWAQQLRKSIFSLV